MADPWRWWPAADIARITGCPVDAITRNWPLIADALDRRGLYDRDICLGVLPTVAIETASTFESIHEYGTPADWAGYDGGAAYAGRGFVQITHLSGYRAAGLALGLDLVNSPDLALDPKNGAEILAWFWQTKGVPAKSGGHFYTLAELCREHDWNWVRRVVQGGTAGLDRLIAMASALDAYADPTQEPATVAYNLPHPVRTQDHDWDCFEESANWALHAAGRAPSDAWLESQMLADGIETTANGLEDGSGAQAAAWISRQYGDGSPALTAYNAANVSFDDVRSVAGSSPVLLGGHHWGAAGHWTGVRGYDAASDTLTLANPGGTGPVYGWQTMSRQQFASIAPCSMVVVTAAGAAAPPAPVPATPDDPSARLLAQVNGLISALAYLADDVAAIEDRGARLEEAQRVREQYVGARPA